MMNSTARALVFVFVAVGWSSASRADSLAGTLLEEARARPGLCLHIGCGDGALTTELARSGRYLVHGLSNDADQVSAARAHIQSAGMYGVASVEYASLTGLPYADNLANLIVVDCLPDVRDAGCSLDELDRVLAPLGVALVGTRDDARRPISEQQLRQALAAAGIDDYEIVDLPGTWAQFTKSWPAEFDEWTHPRHGPDRNPVSHDTRVEPPNNLRWRHGPVWRGVSGAHFSSAGRIISTRTARSAMPSNGLRLYNLQQPGPYKYVTPLAAVDGRIYIHAPRASPYVQAVDALTGNVLLTFEHVKPPVSTGLVVSGGNLIFANREGIGSVVAATGALNWKNEQIKMPGEQPRGTAPLVVADGRVFVSVSRDRRSDRSERAVCLNADTGDVLWQRDTSPTAGALLLHHDGLLIFTDTYRTYPKRIYAYAAADGQPLWQSEPLIAQKSLGVYAIDGLIWCQSNEELIGLDPATGDVKKRHESAPGPFKCALPAATETYIPGGRFGFLELDSGDSTTCFLDRNACGADPGILFSNGLTYTFPKQCSCFSMIRGFTAFTRTDPLSDTGDGGDDPPRLQRGPAFDEVGGSSSGPDDPAAWPAFRHDGRRSASTESSVPMPRRVVWEKRWDAPTAPAWLQTDWRDHPSMSGR